MIVYIVVLIHFCSVTNPKLYKMDNPYKNAQFMQRPQAFHVAGALPANNSQLGWNMRTHIEKAKKPGRIGKKFLNAMDHLFTMIILLSVEEEYETIAIGHIL